METGLPTPDDCQGRHVNLLGNDWDPILTLYPSTAYFIVDIGATSRDADADGHIFSEVLIPGFWPIHIFFQEWGIPQRAPKLQFSWGSRWTMDLWQIYHDISVVNAFIGISPGTSFSAKAILHLASPLKQRTQQLRTCPRSSYSVLSCGAEVLNIPKLECL